MKKTILFLFLLCRLITFAELPSTTETAIFSPSFRSLTVRMEGDRLAPPVLTIDDGGQLIDGVTNRLVIGFDDLSDERQYLRYSIHHCTADWQLSDLVDSEVFDGFNYADVDDYSFSRATTVHYVHYNIYLPNANFSFNISGNYLLQVYPEDNPEDILLQVRFMVQERTVTLGASIESNTDIDYNDAHQQLTLTIDTRNAAIRDANSDLILVVTQNNRPDTERVITHPSRLMGYQAIYDHHQALIFPAGNEYRRMETINNLYPGMGTDHIEFHSPYYYHILNLDKPRANHQYTYDQTQHGRYFIREYNSENSDVEADYVLVQFTLDMLPIPDTDVYLDGDFTQRRYSPSAKMEYDPSTGRYQKLLLLKQGAYNYQYLAVPSSLGSTSAPSAAASPLSHASTASAASPLSPASLPPVPGASAPELNQIEGNKYQTGNEYRVCVYYRPPGARYDRLLLVATLL